MFRPELFLLVLISTIIFNACQENSTADLVIINANVYTVDTLNPHAEAIAISADRIMYVGTNEEALKFKSDETKVMDVEGAFIMPGFIEGHGHFSSLGESLQVLNFSASRSWDEIVGQVAEAVQKTEPGEWIIGFGWHQEKWDSKPEEEVLGFPTHYELSAISPDNPVLLNHASGHAVFVNQKAMEISGVNSEMPNPKGGEILRDASGAPTGLFQENAEDIINHAYQSYLDGIDKQERLGHWLEGIELAQQECLKKGITSFQDAGSNYTTINRYKKLADEHKLRLRLWVMLRQTYNEMKQVASEVRTVGYGDNYFTCRAIKSELDGALGSYGAWLIEPYNDKPGYSGQNTTSLETVDSIAQLAIENNMQLCVHAIGDKANREIINLFENYLKNADNTAPMRWRIEHAQHLNPDDIPRFSDLGIIASMQGIHCTSDAPFVESRLGHERAKNGAYAWRPLLDNDVIIANGTDAPVEDVDPLISLYASVSRKRVDNGMDFFPEQSMTREEAIYSYTMGNAYAAFEESLKGSIEKGKLADLVMLSNDLQKCSEQEILETKVMMTMVGGKIQYEYSNN